MVRLEAGSLHLAKYHIRFRGLFLIAKVVINFKIATDPGSSPG